MGVQPKSLVLILARELASNVATPMFLCDREGTMVFYNEPAERLFGVPFAQVGEVPLSELALTLAPETLGGERMSRANAAPGLALLQQRPAHQVLRVTALDGVQRVVEVTAFPLFVKADEFAGAVAVFWELDDQALQNDLALHDDSDIHEDGDRGAGDDLGL